MTDLTSGNARTPAMTGSLDGFTAELTTALNRLDRERRSSFARPGQRAEATERFMQAVEKAVERVRGTDRIAARSAHALDRAADLATAQADEKTIRGLKADLELLREHLATMEGKLAMARDHTCPEPLPQRKGVTRESELARLREGVIQPGPQWSDAAREPATDAAVAPERPVRPATARKARSAGPGKGGSPQAATKAPGGSA